MEKGRITKLTNLHVVCGISQQPSKGDGVSYGAQVNKQDGRQRLNVQGVVEVAGEEWKFSFDVQNETSTEPGIQKRPLTHNKKNILFKCSFCILCLIFVYLSLYSLKLGYMFLIR